MVYVGLLHTRPLLAVAAAAVVAAAWEGLVGGSLAHVHAHEFTFGEIGLTKSRGNDPHRFPISISFAHAFSPSFSEADVACARVVFHLFIFNSVGVAATPNSAMSVLTYTSGWRVTDGQRGI